MDRTLAARMRRYRLRRALRANLVKCLSAGICEGEVIALLHSLSSVTVQGERDERTCDMFVENGRSIPGLVAQPKVDRGGGGETVPPFGRNGDRGYGAVA